LLKTFQHLDVNQNGEINLEELLVGWREVASPEQLQSGE